MPYLVALACSEVGEEWAFLSNYQEQAATHDSTLVLFAVLALVRPLRAM